MAYESILINADDEHRLPGVLGVASAIASDHSAHVTAICVLPRPVIVPGGMPGSSDVITFDQQRRDARGEAERMRRAFEAATRGKPYATEWKLDDGLVGNDIDALIAQGRLADLIVAANARHLSDGSHSFLSTERLVIEVGRPVVLVPKGYVAHSVGDRILIAWNGSREATRAVFDALPLLRRAHHVKVLHVETAGMSKISLSSCAAIAASLRRHGVRAIYEELALPRAVDGAALLSAAKAENADLLVMGGYGHWRFRELVLGGATRHVMRHMMVPVLMSH